jgi:hypothetical protein
MRPRRFGETGKQNWRSRLGAGQAHLRFASGVLREDQAPSGRIPIHNLWTPNWRVALHFQQASLPCAVGIHDIDMIEPIVRITVRLKDDLLAIR